MLNGPQRAGPFSFLRTTAGEADSFIVNQFILNHYLVMKADILRLCVASSGVVMVSCIFFFLNNLSVN